MTRQNRKYETPPADDQAGSNYDLDQTLTQASLASAPSGGGRQVVLVPGQPKDGEMREQENLPEVPSGVYHPRATAKAHPAGVRLRRPSWFWPGFAAGFLLLSMVSCGGLVMATGLNRLDLAEIQGGGVVWTPPAVTPIATPNAAVAADTGGAFQLGESARNITGSRVNIRQTPGHLGKPDSDIVAQLQPGDTMQIVAGPASADNLVWWLIQYQAGDGRVVEGWVAEATGSGVQILGR
jgi:hypothetical protein